MRARERVTMQTAQLKQHMARDDELRPPVTTRGISGERIVARDMRVNDFNAVSSDKPRQLVRARHVERVAQRQRLDVRAIDFEMSDQRRVWPHDGVEIVPARDE